MINKDLELITRRGIHYQTENSKILRYQPWLGDMFSPMYDLIMSKSIFPKKFNASSDTHTEFLKDILSDCQNQNVLELGTGSGNLAGILANNNIYRGVDISAGLLRIAHKRFRTRNFKDFKLFVSNVTDLPFEDSSFDISICNLSLNFFPSIEDVVKEIKRVLKSSGVFYCSVPVPEYNEKHQTIRGTLLKKDELSTLFRANGFEFSELSMRNGVLFYFKAVKKLEN